MCFPLDLLVPRKCRNNCQILVTAVEQRVILGRPYKTVDRFASLNYLRSEHTTPAPGLDLAIFSSSGQSSFIAPLDANDSSRVGFRNLFIDASCFRD